MERVCEYCGKTFDATGRTSRKTCSEECRKKRKIKLDNKRRGKKRKRNRLPEKISLGQIAGFGSLSLDQWVMAASYLGVSYGRLRGMYSIGQISQKEIIAAINGRVEQIYEERKRIV